MYEKPMKEIEGRSEFLTWGSDLDGNSRFAIVQESPGHGLRCFDDLSAHEVRRSQGCFYDGVPEHPEGALAWAINSARLAQKKIKEILREAGY